MDMFNWPRQSRADIQEFFCTGGVWQTWTKPRGVDMVMMFCVGAGGGGGAGLSANSGNPRGGGGGGSGSSIVRALFPIMLLPDVLYIQVGTGGAGGASSGSAGAVGGVTYVSAAPNVAPAFLFAVAPNGTAPGGAAGTAAGSNAGGSGPGSASAAQMLLVSAGLFVAIAGSAGGASGAISGANGAVGGAISAFAINQVCAGSGGGTVGTNDANFAGGNLNASTSLIPSTISGGAAGGGKGPSGWTSKKPWFSTGGLGGGTNGASGVGGAGGDGAIGSGGGGGGGGVTGGAGGSGGPGYVLIVSW